MKPKQRGHVKLRALGWATVFIFGSPIFLLIKLGRSIAWLRGADDVNKLAWGGVAIFYALIMGAIFINSWLFVAALFTLAIFEVAAMIAESKRGGC